MAIDFYKVFEQLSRLYEQQELTEGTKYDEKAIKKLAESGLFDEETSAKIINALFREDIHAFVHSPSWLEKYLVGIANMLIKYANGDRNKAAEFLRECPNIFDQYLTYVKEQRAKIENDKDKVAFDNKFIQEMSYEDVKKELDDIQEKRDRQSKDELSKMEFGAESDYELIPIDSYEQMHKLFGGAWTGDGSSSKYAGAGGTAWCHTNSKSVYDVWVNDGKNKFYVLAHKNWKKITFDIWSNEDNPKDAYGNSLVALLVSAKTNALKNATLRCNHVGVDSNADNQYTTYAELSRIAGFNVEEKINELHPVKIKPIDYSVFDGSRKSFREFIAINDLDSIRDVTTFIIPDSVTSIGDSAFEYCTALQSITIPNSVTSIGEYTFFHCTSLTSITIPNSVTLIGDSAFTDCWALLSITIPNSVVSIGNNAFQYCTSLQSITVPNSVTSIGDYAFEYCSSLTSITIPNSVTSIGSNAFSSCWSLQSITIPNSVTSIGDYMFKGCSALNTIYYNGGNIKVLDELPKSADILDPETGEVLRKKQQG